MSGVGTGHMAQESSSQPGVARIEVYIDESPLSQLALLSDLMPILNYRE
jgi:hypothetical protein